MDWSKIDKFYIALTVVLIVVSAILVFSFRGVFQAFFTAYEIDQSKIETELKVQKERLDEAYNFVFNKTQVPLEIK